MTTLVRNVQRAAVLVAVMLVAACSGKGSMSATGPSGLAGGSSAGTATISGRVNAGSSLASSAPQSLSSAARGTVSVPLGTASSSVLTVTVIGTDVSATVDPGGTFTLTNVPAGTVGLRFTGRGFDATLTISGITDQDHLQIAVTLNGGEARLESSEHLSTDNRAEIDGQITSIDAAARTLNVAGTLVAVQSSTVVRRGSTTLAFADLAVGDRVEVKGTRSGATVTASEIMIEQDDGEDQNDEADTKGTVAGLSGNCPSLSFTVGTTKVTTSGATFFDNGGCTAIANGLRVEVSGTRGSDGTIAASKVERDS